MTFSGLPLTLAVIVIDPEAATLSGCISRETTVTVVVVADDFCVSSAAAARSAVICALASVSAASDASELARRVSSAADLAFASASCPDSSVRAALTFCVAANCVKKYIPTSPTASPTIRDVITQPQNLLSCMRM